MKKNFLKIAALLIAAMLLVVSCSQEVKAPEAEDNGLVEAKLNVAFGKAVEIGADNNARIQYKYSLTPKWKQLANGNDPYGKKENQVIDGFCSISEPPAISALGYVSPGLWDVEVKGYLCSSSTTSEGTTTYTATGEVVLEGSATVYFGGEKNTVTVLIAPSNSNTTVASNGKVTINLQMQDLEGEKGILYKLDGGEYTPLARSKNPIASDNAAHSYTTTLNSVSAGYHTISFKIDGYNGGVTRSFYLLKDNDVRITGSVTPSEFVRESASISVLALGKGNISLSNTTPGTTNGGYKTESTCTATVGGFSIPKVGNGITSVVMSYAWYWGVNNTNSVLQEGEVVKDSSQSINIKLPTVPGRYTLSCIATCTVTYTSDDGSTVQYILNGDAALQEFLVD